MTEPTDDDSLVTGVSWRSGSPALVGGRAPGTERREPLHLGAAVGWRVSGPRRCTGVWLPDIGEARPCPTANTVAATATTAQCTACAAADPGRALARNFTIDDPRRFAVYLAWFGDDLLKIGLTATGRGADRLAEQGALAFSWLARGSFRAARRLEQTAAATGDVRERVPRRAKLAAWWNPPGGDTARDQLAVAHQHLTTSLVATADLEPAPCEVQHLAPMYGLTGQVVADEEVTALADGAVLSGYLTCLAGHDALITGTRGDLLVDLRLLTGWTVTPAPPSAPVDRLTTTPVPRDDESPGTQGTLF